MTETQLAGLLMDLLFTTTGIVVCAVQLVRHRIPSRLEEGPPPSTREIVLTVAALFFAGIAPNVLVAATTPRFPMGMAMLGRYALMPSVLGIFLVAGVAHRSREKRFLNRLGTGIWVGAAATGSLDVVRLAGFYLGLMPGNMPRMFGVMLLDRMALGPSPTSDFIGYLYHYWVGAAFGMVYTLVCGRSRWWVAVIWALIIEVGMMTTPPMVIAMDTGFFGLKRGFGLLGVSLIAHVTFGVFLGLLTERYVQHPGSVVELARRAFRALVPC